DEQTGVLREPVERPADLGQPGAELDVADLDRHRRVLERDELELGAVDGRDRVIDESLDPGRRRSGSRQREVAAVESVAARELGAGSPGEPGGRPGRRART